MTEQFPNAEFGSHYVPSVPIGHFNRIIPLRIEHVKEIKYFITTLLSPPPLLQFNQKTFITT